MRHIPYASLCAFEAAVRHESFARAAAELNLTAAGISQHVRIMENWLGVALFTRHARGVTATAAGREFGAVVASGLGHIQNAAQQLKRESHDRPVSVACIASFATRWLIPRLPDFRKEHPEIRINIVYALDAKTPEAASVDLLIRHGTRPGANSIPLLSAQTRPTCSTEFKLRHGSFNAPADLVDAELLHDETTAAWARWFALKGVHRPLKPGPIFADFSLMIGSVIGAQGIGLCPVSLIAEELANGTLVTLFDSPLDTDKFYWLIEADRLSREAETFRDWLVAESCRSESKLVP
ncbi:MULTISPECIES: LysR substrate-binding domain-containing protein [Rhizobium]|uniref:LysR family transcriptional regulator, glycine cleavage system transcriptional activator n=1 Tax=Rhizobium miluonense TaxID=411945 RepID=A0A1C3VC90_9HYPH|nr:LysR substrate-binding domain-containing protein [Rhizobium miluonense]SCB25430.1 LysR family transcriptional regulator, glycine cleavage system transcriptional activator [Rhizobium miluonense]